MSYIKINIGGRERGLKFNQMAVVVMAQKADLDNYEATANYAMIYAGLKANAYVKGEELTKTVPHATKPNEAVEVPATFEDVCNWVEETPTDVQIAVFEVFQETQAYKNLIAKADIDQTPVTKKKSRNSEKKT